MNTTRTVFVCCLFALQGCGPELPSPTQTTTGLNPEPALKQRTIQLPARTVCHVMQDDRPVLVVWSDAAPPDAVAESGDLPEDDILKHLNQNFLSEKVVLKYRNPENHSAPERHHNRVITLAPYAERNAVQLVVVDYGESVLTNVLDLNEGALIVVSVKDKQIHQLKHDINQLKFDSVSLTSYSRQHPDIEAVFHDGAKAD